MKNTLTTLRTLACASALLGLFSTGVRGVEPQRSQLAQALSFGFYGSDNVIWRNLVNPEQRDALYEPLHAGEQLKYNDFSATLFVSRAPQLLYAVKDMVDMDVIESVGGEALKAMMITNGIGVGDAPNVDDYDDYAEFEADENAYLSNQAGVISNYVQQLRTLVGGITFQEHRVGAVFQKEWLFNKNLYVAVKTWAGVSERNYWLESDDRQLLASMISQLSPASAQTSSFNLSDFVSMTWGIGDTHVLCGLIAPLEHHVTLRAGLKGIIPMATEAERETVHQVAPLEAHKFITFLRKRLNEILIAPILGNGGHFGVGFWSDATWKTRLYNDKHELAVHLYGQVDFLLPSFEERLLLQYLTQDVKADSAGEDYDAFVSDDAALRTCISQYILPDPISVSIAPGALGRLGLKGQYTFGRVVTTVGYDWYCRGQEVMSYFMQGNEAQVYKPLQNTYPSMAQQHKLFGSISYNELFTDVKSAWHTFPTLGLSVGLHTAYGLSASGMGKDFNVGIALGIKC